MSQVAYGQRAEWQDVTPVPQDDGPLPIVVIKYPPGFQEVHGYFRAIQQRDEYSWRALALTTDVIEFNAANYTAWYYRRRCLKELGPDLKDELEFTAQWACDSPKNYQVWYHRRWLIMEMADRLRRLSASAEEADRQIREIALAELTFHEGVMQENDDFKNYNGWSHRTFIVQKFGLWDQEMPFVEGLLNLDIRNNSAWNHRFTVVRNTTWPLTEGARDREVKFVMDCLRRCAMNESAWNYLAAFYGTGEGKVPWDSNPAVEAFCREVLATPSPTGGMSCRFAAEVLAQVHNARGETEETQKWYRLLQHHDAIRASYWAWRSDLIEKQATAEGEG